MNANYKKGVWESELITGKKMICDTNNNQIRIVDEATGQPATVYNFSDGIRTSDVERVRETTIASLKSRKF